MSISAVWDATMLPARSTAALYRPTLARTSPSLRRALVALDYHLQPHGLQLVVRGTLEDRMSSEVIIPGMLSFLLEPPVLSATWSRRRGTPRR